MHGCVVVVTWGRRLAEVGGTVRALFGKFIYAWVSERKTIVLAQTWNFRRMPVGAGCCKYAPIWPKRWRRVKKCRRPQWWVS